MLMQIIFGQALPLLTRLAKEAMETKERMAQVWWQCVAENAGHQGLLESFNQHVGDGRLVRKG